MTLRTQAAIIAGVAVVALGATGAVSYTLGSDGGKPAVPAAVQTPFPTPSVDHDREACHRLSLVGDETTRDPAVMLGVADAARLASDEGIRLAGVALTPIYAYGGPQPGRESLHAEQVALDLASACAAKYGDGPW